MANDKTWELPGPSSPPPPVYSATVEPRRYNLREKIPGIIDGIKAIKQWLIADLMATTMFLIAISCIAVFLAFLILSDADSKHILCRSPYAVRFYEQMPITAATNTIGALPGALFALVGYRGKPNENGEVRVYRLSNVVDTAFKRWVFQGSTLLLGIVLSNLAAAKLERQPLDCPA